MSVKGVDISDNNGNVDFPALQKAGVEFVLIRCGYGSDYADQDDGEFFANVRKAKAAGMPYGVWLYSYALNTSQAESEAAHALRLLRQVDKPTYGVWFDMEDADGYKQRKGMPSNDTLVRICDIFCREIQTAGYYCGIYASLSWLENQLSDPRLDKYDKWVAQWNSTCEYTKPYGIWQYTDKLVIGGKAFDGNLAYKDYLALTEKKKEEKEVRYNTVAEVPDYAQDTIKKLCDKHVLAGKDNKIDSKGYPAKLDLSEDMIRMLVMNDRAGLYD